MIEVSPSSDWCQRWQHQTSTWRHKHDGGFDAGRYTVEEVGETDAKNYIVNHHYSSAYPAASRRYGLFENHESRTDLVGVAVLGIPVQASVLTGVLPDLQPYVESLELSRLVLADRVPGNGETWFLARVFEHAANRGVRGIVSFADPCPRSIAGRLIFPGHIGTIYQASNALYCGRGTPRTLTLLPNGQVLNNRAMQKVRRQDRGHDYVEKQLVDMGATPLHGQPNVWLAQALDEVGATRIRHAGNHRYVFRLGVTPAARRRVRVNATSQPYPKERDAA